MKSKKSNKRKSKQQTDKEYSKATILALIGIVLLCIPIVLFILLNYLWLAVPESAWIVIGFVGSFVIGVGLFNAIMGLGKASLGIKFTLICSLSGIILIAISELLMYNSHLFNQDLVSYYFLTLLFCVGTLISYPIFRYGINTYLRKTRGLSQTNINKHKKGKKNYWWYEEIHKEFGIGKLYHLNKAYTILFLVNFFSNLIFGFFKFASIFTCSFSLILYVFTAIIGFYGMRQYHVDEHGSTFVLFARNSSGKIDSSLFDLFFLAFPCGMAYAHITAIIGLWN
ncbi:MAG: hypothetical protein IJ400_03880 [Clostridia bacterium]|nr:hypothetical protein [Clostridia bacterium]